MRFIRIKTPGILLLLTLEVLWATAGTNGSQALAQGFFSQDRVAPEEATGPRGAADETPLMRVTDPSFVKIGGVPLPGQLSPGFVPQGGIRKVQGLEACTQFPARLVFLNGANISTVREQDLQNVSVTIDQNGNLHLKAAHYEVNTDSSYHPLLPSELPRLPKPVPAPDGLPHARYSKETGRPSEGTPSEARTDVPSDAEVQSSAVRTQPAAPSSRTQKDQGRQGVTGGVPPITQAPAAQNAP